jgi:predicted DNA-binding protein
MVYTASIMDIRTNIYLRDDQMKRLKLLHEKTGAPVAELVRRAIDEYLKQRARELK